MRTLLCGRIQLEEKPIFDLIFDKLASKKIPTEYTIKDHLTTQIKKK